MNQVEVMSGEMSEALAVYKDVITQTAQVFGAYASEKVMARAVKAGERLAIAAIERRNKHGEASDDSYFDHRCRTDPADG
jgi:hypothetical protein